MMITQSFCRIGKSDLLTDVPENRQNLLRFLEEKGWLYEQFNVKQQSV